VDLELIWKNVQDLPNVHPAFVTEENLRPTREPTAAEVNHGSSNPVAKPDDGVIGAEPDESRRIAALGSLPCANEYALGRSAITTLVAVDQRAERSEYHHR
jgi:hypothetical protein